MPPRSKPGLPVASYLGWLAAQHSGINLIGVGENVELPLDDLYVPLALSTHQRRLAAEHLTAPDSRRCSPDNFRFDLVHMFDKLALGTEHALLSGEAGTGKTTALKKLLHQCRSDASSLHLHPDYVPVFARLRDWDGDKHHSLREFCRYALSTQGQLSNDSGDSISSLPANTVDSLWDHGKLLLLLDGLDEIANDADRVALCGFLATQLNLTENAGVRVVVSSRPYGYAGDISLPAKFCTFEIQALRPDDIEKLVVRWFGEAAKVLPQLSPKRANKCAKELVEKLRGPFGQRQQVMFSTPLLLTLLCVVVQNDKAMPRNRAEFFSSCLEVLLERWPAAKLRSDSDEEIGQKLPLDTDTAIAVLRPIAYNLQKAGVEQLDSDDLYLALEDGLSKHPADPGDVQDWLYKQAAVLAIVSHGRNAKPQFGFVHRSIREYLTALHIAEEELVGEVAGDFAEKWWYDVARLLVTLPRYPVFGPLMREMLKTDALLIPETRRVLRDCVIDARTPDMRPFAEFIADPDVDAHRRQEALHLLLGQHEPELVAAAKSVLASKSIPTSLRQMAQVFLDQASEQQSDEYAWDVVFVFAEPDRAFAEQLEELLTRRARPLRVWKQGKTLVSADSLELRLLVKHVRRALAIYHTHAPDAAKLLRHYAEREALVRVATQNSPQGPPDSIRLKNTTADLVALYQALKPPARTQDSGAELPHSKPATRGPQVRRPTKAVRPQPGQVGVEPVTGMRFVYVPKGTFWMESKQFSNTQPIREVSLSGFWLGETPVTNAEYGKFLKANPKVGKPLFWNSLSFSDPRQPVVGVSWDDATAFCEWMQQVAGVNATLPSEAQWEYAARGPDNRLYPWGNQPPTPERACYEVSGVEAPRVVGSYPAGRGPFNALDQSGTVWEWCLDVWNEDAYKIRSSRVDPVNTEGDSTYRSLRGGSWYSSEVGLAAAVRSRYWAGLRLGDGGFRVCLREHLDH